MQIIGCVKGIIFIYGMWPDFAPKEATKNKPPKIRYRYVLLRALLQVRNLDPQNLSEILVKIKTKT